jgi:hypothetical protein
VELLAPSRELSEALLRRLGVLVAKRQDLRAQAAPEFLLEQNRLEIVQTQLELSDALVSEHLKADVA